MQLTFGRSDSTATMTAPCSHVRGGTAILLTQDQDFWDDRQFPEHRNPGLVILPGANGNQTDMIRGLVWMLLLMRTNLLQWQKQKVRITRDGEVYTKLRDWRTGAMVAKRYRFTGRHRALEFL